MSLHPLNGEMLVTETLLTGLAVAGGFGLRSHGHPTAALGAWAFAGLVVLMVASSAVAERESYPPREVLGSVLRGLLVLAYLAAAGVGADWLGRRYHPALGALALLLAALGLPLGAVLALNAWEERRGRR